MSLNLTPLPKRVRYVKRRAPMRREMYVYYEVHELQVGPFGWRPVCQVVVNFITKGRPVITVERAEMGTRFTWERHSPGIPTTVQEFKEAYRKALDSPHLVVK